GRTEIDIQMVAEAVSGEELVVVGYGTEERATLTGSISSIDSEELSRTPALGTSDRLVGKVQGLTARKADARPGATAAIQIRNMGSPLFIIDGVPANHDDFNELGDGDIETISVLKDASAAVYGMRAANGVILVETKRGNFGVNQTEVNITGQFGVQNLTRYPQPANAYQFHRAKIESDQNEGDPPRMSVEELQNWRQGGSGYESYDYYDIVMDQASEYQLGVNVSGGSENVRYFLSADNALENAMLNDFLYTRTNLQANIDGKLNDKLTIGTQIRGRYEHNKQVGGPGGDDYSNPLTSVINMWPHEPMYANNNPQYLRMSHNLVANPAIIERDVAGILDDYTNEITAKLYASYDFDFGMTAQATYSYRFFHLLNRAYERTYDAYRYNETDGYYTQPGWGNSDGFRDDETSQGNTRFAQIRLNYEKSFEDHNISALLAYEQQKEEFDFRSIQTNASTNYIPIQYISELVNLDHNIFEETRAGVVGRFKYNYREKYLIEVLGRYDGSYLFAPEKRWGLFPGISVGWRLSEESFMNEVDILSNLKLRASYGVTGSETIGSGGLGVGYVFEVNDRIGRNRDFIVEPYNYLEGYDFQEGGSVFNGNNVIGTQPRGLPVTNLTWVENISTNIGIDFSLFEEKISGTVEVFQRKRKGLPAPRYDLLLPEEVGYSLPPENLNSDAIRGLEGSLTYNGRITTDVSYSIGANATFARQRDISTYKPRFENSWDEYRNSTENRWSYINWGYQVVDRFQSETEIENYPVNIDGQGNRTLLPGDFIYKDVNGDGIINGMDERPIGYADDRNPILNLGVNGQVNYKAFQLVVGFVGGTLQSWNQAGAVRYPFFNNGNSPEYLLTDRWHRTDPYDAQSSWVSGRYPAVREGNFEHSN
ncbi:MAG TPA: SusC/RagA family TonB-linked outer membrane protein, partial [Fodinibius sp.]|nr:SusC/RagA family TonB-linked outer membrane protein [Fodinibius sp.]